MATKQQATAKVTKQKASVRNHPGVPRDGVSSRPAPRVGEVLRQLRTQSRMSLRQVAETSGLSVSFLGAVERGESDIAVGRLAQVAAVFDHDAASLLGYTMRHSEPRVLRREARIHVPRGEGVDFTAIRIPGTSVELMTATLQPRSTFDDITSHAGIDVLLVMDGAVVLVFDGVDYPVSASECIVWPASHPHSIRNDGAKRARIIGFTTETIY